MPLGHSCNPIPVFFLVGPFFLLAMFFVYIRSKVSLDGIANKIYTLCQNVRAYISSEHFIRKNF